MIRRDIIFKDFAAVKTDTMVCWIMTPCSLVGRQVDTNILDTQRLHFWHSSHSSCKLVCLYNPPRPQVS